MPLFITEEELRLLDPPAVAERADGFIRDLQVQLETARAQAEAASITSEQTSSLLEQRYLSLSSDYYRLESLKSDLSASLDQRLADLANLRAENHQLRLHTIEKDGEIERLSVEVSELHKSKRQLLELVELKDAEIGDKNGLIKDYVDKIVDLSENRAQKEARLHDIETELERCRAACARLSQEKELIEKHNTWLNEELTAKVNNLVEVRKNQMSLEAEMSGKVADLDRKINECTSSLNWHKERVRELETRLTSTEELLCSSKETAAVNEERFSAELSTVSKLVELYKESADEWSRKAGEQEGVIKALETYLSQVENDYKEQLEKEASTRRDNEKEVAELKLKLEKCEMELEKARRANEWGLSPITSSEMGSLTEGMDINDEGNHKLVPKMPMNISGTALAASLTRDGWSLTKMYEKYQEAADALRHEQLGRKHSEALLKRVLSEIEERSEFILEERAEHDRMVEAYDLMNHKLQQSRSELASRENTIQELKAELKRHEREYNVAQKEILDLETQVTVLLKECRDVQLRCSGMGEVLDGDIIPGDVVQHNTESDADKVISEHLLTFRDIKGLVEQNVHLRSLVRDLSRHNEERDAELKESFKVELQKHIDEATSKVSVVLKRSEEQGRMIESLHSSVAMYKRLYEEAHKPRSDFSQSAEPILDAHAEDRRADLMLLFEGSQEATRKTHQQLVERAKNLEDDLVKSRSEVMSLRLERDKLAMESKFVRERLDSFIREYEHQRDEANGIRARNVEFTQLIIDYQRRLRESSDSLQASEENVRKLSMEVSILKHEREIMVNSEKRASEEVQSLSDRVRRLQASLDTIQSSQEARDDARAMERRMQDDYIRRTERDWAEAKAELQEERDRVRMLTLEKDKKIEHAMGQMDELRKELADALHRIAASEARAAAAEARYSELKAKAESSGTKDVGLDASHTSISSMTEKLKEEMEKLKEEAQINKDYMQQYKQIAQVNEIALKQIEAAHEEYKSESEKKKKTLEAEILSLSEKVSELESDVILKSSEASSAVSAKEDALLAAQSDFERLNEESSMKTSQIVAMEFQINQLKEDLEKEHLRWRSAQDNYERQVILQSETIQELTKTSEALASVQAELVDLRRLANSQKAEKEELHTRWDTERLVLLESKNEAERKYNEINEQNHILHKRLEELHVKFADRERSSAGISSSMISSEAKGENDLQNVINYLRRSKEIAETEICLLKQEKQRLQSQLDSALKASETAQSLLNAEREHSRTILFSDEEFKSLQLQVREINLLRESNMQLREENKHNFEEYQKFREMAQKARMEIEELSSQLKEKQLQVDAYHKEVGLKNVEIMNLENKFTELLESSSKVSAAEHEQIKNDLQQTKEILRDTEADLVEKVNLVSELQAKISQLTQELESRQLELRERDTKISDFLQMEANFKSENEKIKKANYNLKRRFEMLAKERDELTKVNQGLLKQVEDFRSSRRASSESTLQQAIKEKEKEKDARIQILEKTLEMEREKRKRNEKTLQQLNKNINQRKDEMLSELGKHKLAREKLLETGMLPSQLPPETDLDERTAAYIQAVENFEEAVHPELGEAAGATQQPPETSLVADAPLAAAAEQAAPQPSVNSPHGKAIQGKDIRPTLAKPSIEARRTSRRLIRPSLELEEPSGDVEMPEIEASTVPEVKVVKLHEPPCDSALLGTSGARKRVASSSATELREEVFVEETSAVSSMLKKSKGSESPKEVAEAHDPSIPSADMIVLPGTPSELNEVPVDHEEDINAGADEKMQTTTEPTEEPRETPSDVMNLGESQTLGSDSAVPGGILDKPIETLEILDEWVKNNEVLDSQKPSATDEAVEDDIEEGELSPDASEERESGESVDGAGTDEGALGDMGDALPVASPEILNEEKNEGSDLVEEAADGLESNNNDQGGMEVEQAPIASFGAREGSPSVSAEAPSILAEAAVSESGSSATVAAESDTRSARGGSRTIHLRSRAQENAARRLSGVGTPPLARSRGRMASSGRGDSMRGGARTRGRRGGRGQSSGDRE